MLSIIGNYFDALLMMLAEMSPYLLLGFFFAGLLHAFVPKSIYRKHLAPRNMASVVKAAALGIPLPLCSCGVIPTSVSLRREGASHGACTSFLIATPQTGVDSIAATYSLMGLPFAVVRPLAALCTSMLGGWLVNKFARDDESLSEKATTSQQPTPNTQHPSPKWQEKLRQSMHYAFVEMLQDVGKWLVMGLLIAALITVAVPNEWLAALHDYKLLNMLIVLAVAIPMYVCATGSIPIAVSLMAKGLTPGAALVLLMAGPAVNSASMLVVGKVFGRRTLQLYLVSIIVGAVAFGLAIDYLLPQSWFVVNSMMMGGGHCANCLTPMDWVWMGIFLLLLVNAFVQKLWQSRIMERVSKQEVRGKKHEVRGMEHEVRGLKQEAGGVKQEASLSVYEVREMSCNHCKANVERIIGGIAGVESVEVDLVKGIAYVRGQHDHKEVERQVTASGYPTKQQ